MKRLLWLLIGLSLIVSAPRAQMTMMGVENGAGVVYNGPGDVVSGAKGFWGLRAYNGTYASGHGKLARVCTPADAICDDVNSDSSGNFNIAASLVSACNNSGTICTVKTLYDQSGASNCSGACDVTNSTIANRPILVVPGAANGCTTTAKFCMSSSPAGAQSLVAIADMTGTTAQPFTISTVFNNPVRTTDEYLFDSSNFSQPQVVSGFGGTNRIVIQMNSGGGPTQAVSDGAYHAVQSVFNNTTSDINVDGTSNAPLALASAASFTTIRICLLNATGPTGGTGSFGGFSQEFGLWPVGFTTTAVTGQSALMSTNQHTYWGF